MKIELTNTEKELLETLREFRRGGATDKVLEAKIDRLVEELQVPERP